MKRVTAAVIIENGRLFLARRAVGDPLEGMWELPGGKIEDDETPQECVERELLEELQMRTAAGAILATTEYHYEHGSFELIAISVERESAFEPAVHDATAWVRRRDLDQHPLAPADVKLIGALASAGIW